MWGSEYSLLYIPLSQVVEEVMAALQTYELKQLPDTLRRDYETVTNLRDVDRQFCSANVLTGPDIAEFWVRLTFDDDPQLFADVNYKRVKLPLERLHCVRFTLQ